jgi:tRNA G46 methylase TrmB
MANRYSAGSVEKNIQNLTKAHDEVIQATSATSVLEIASGFGDHILSYAKNHPDTTFQPTECNEYLVNQLRKRVTEANLPNVSQPLKLDVLAGEWRSTTTM